MLRQNSGLEGNRLSPEETKAILELHQNRTDATTVGNVAEAIGATPVEVQRMLDEVRNRRVPPAVPTPPTQSKFFIRAGVILASLLGAGILWGSLFSAGWIYGAARNAGPSVRVSQPESGLDRYNRLVATGEYTAAYGLGRQLVSGSLAGQSDALNTLAWNIVDPDNPPAVKDLDLALEAARRAVHLDNRQSWHILDTLARVQFERGDIDGAIKTQTEAMLKAPDSSVSTARRPLLEYQAAKDMQPEIGSPTPPAAPTER